MLNHDQKYHLIIPQLILKMLATNFLRKIVEKFIINPKHRHIFQNHACRHFQLGRVRCGRKEN